MPKGLVHGCCPKNRSFSYRCFSQKFCQKRSFFDIFDRKQSFLDQKIEVLTRAKKMDIAKWVVHGFWQKNRSFSYRCFSQKFCQKRSFFNILDRKQLFLDQKIEVLTRVKKWTVFKGVSPWILSKNRTFSYRCFSQKLYQKRSFFDILDRKQSFLDKKIDAFSRAKQWTFFKGVSQSILSKSRTFSDRCFSQKLCQKRSRSIFWIENNHFETK